MKITKKQLNELAVVFKRHDVLFAYLFGSQITCRTIFDSDYDIAIMLPQSFSPAKRFSIRLKMMTELSRALNHQGVDVVVLNEARSLVFKYAIIVEGEKIYEADSLARLDFELLTQNEYFDFKSFLTEYNKSYLTKVLQT